MANKMSAFILTVLITSGSSNSLNDESKRFLLADPDVLANRISNLEKSLVQLQSNGQMDKSIKDQAGTIAQLYSNNQELDNVVKQQKAIILSQSTNIQQLEYTITNLQKRPLTNNVISTYTIWGKTGCPTNNNTELVYSGYVGGGMYSNKGSSQDILCMTKDPSFRKISSPDFGYIYGAEYDSAFYGPNANGEDMPCAVCMRKSALKSIMIPGRNTCYAGWFPEYNGYLASQHHTHPSGTNFICVADPHDYLDGGAVNTNSGKLLGPVRAKCGTLKCPPYHDNYPITCVVCSK